MFASFKIEDVSASILRNISKRVFCRVTDALVIDDTGIIVEDSVMKADSDVSDSKGQADPARITGLLYKSAALSFYSVLVFRSYQSR